MLHTRRDTIKTGLAVGGLALTSSPLAATSGLVRRPIPSSGEEIPIVGVGTSRYGVGHSAAERIPLRETLERFHALGGTVIDTAPMYRSSETVLGELIDELSIASDLFMATKVDRQGHTQNVARMERSFRLLKYSTIDLMQCHNLIGWREAIPLMKEWKDAGRIRYIGITTSSKEQYGDFEHIMRDYDLDFIQVNYSLANQRVAADRLLPLAGIAAWRCC